VTLDQLRAFVAVVDEGSFSAAARRLRRVQSAVSHAMAALEGQLGVALFDRTRRRPALTERGKLVEAAARRVLLEVNELGRVADGLAGGLEPTVAIVVDAVFPLDALVEVCRGFTRAQKDVALRVHTETLSAVAALVRDGTCQLGVVGPAADASGLEKRHLSTVRMIPVAAASHPLARARGPLPTARLAEHVQIVLGERGAPPGGPEHGVLSPQTWRVVDLATKHRLLLGGLGWGNLPEPMVRGDLARRRLVRLRPAAWGEDEHLLPLALVTRPDVSLGPAARWLGEQLAATCAKVMG
jgi:DNA-binding transcriptional LysR family regulator